jgi:hypothetical protein
MRQSIQSFDTPGGSSQANNSMITPGHDEDMVNEETMVCKISELEEIVKEKDALIQNYEDQIVQIDKHYEEKEKKLKDKKN